MKIFIGNAPIYFFATKFSVGILPVLKGMRGLQDDMRGGFES